MSATKEITFHGYKITANAHRVTFDDWVGGYLVEKNSQTVRLRLSVVWRDTAEAAASAALVFGTQFVDRCQLKAAASRSAMGASSALSERRG